MLPCPKTFPSFFVPFYFLSFLMLIYSFITDYQAFNLRYKVIQRGTKTRQKWVNNPLINFKMHFMAIKRSAFVAADEALL